MKKYFLSFEFFNVNQKVNKYFWGIVGINLAETSLMDFCKDTISAGFADIDIDNVKIKVLAFNLV